MNGMATILLAAATLTGPQAPSARSSSVPLKTKCIITSIHEVEVPAGRIGALKSLVKREGQYVAQDAVVAKIDARDAEARVRLAEFRREQAQLQAENRFRVEAAKKATEAAKYEHQQSLQINERSPGAVSEFEIKRLQVQAERLELTAKAEERALQEAAALEKERREEVVIAKNDLQDREVRSPIPGIVAELFRHDGEWLQQGEPIMRIIEMDRLKAEAYVSLSDVLPQEIEGRSVSVVLHYGDGLSQKFDKCPVEFISPEVEPGGRYRIWAGVPNRHWSGSTQWILRPGMVAEMILPTARTLQGSAVEDQPQ